MKRLHSLVGLSAILLFTACQKNTQFESEQNMTESSISARNSDDHDGNHNDWDNDDDDERYLVFYALGEGNRLDKFRSDDTYDMLGSAIITGVAAGEMIIAIDFRPATGQLYGLGSTSRLYVINPQSGVARPLGAAPFTPALSGNVAGFDFNPTVDRIRVVTSSGQNLRLNPETGGVAATDLSINGVAGAMVTSVAYSGNVAGATTTILYDIDVKTDKLYMQNPPNDGVLVEVGSLKVNFEGEGGFDIAPPELEDNSNHSNYSAHQRPTDHSALAIYQVNKKSALFSIDLSSGRARRIEKFNGNYDYYGIAIPTQKTAYAVSGTNFYIFNPNKTAGVVTKTIVGLQAGETIAGLDFRPANGQLYGVGSNSRLYTINASSGLASFVATLSVPLAGTSFGVDFNPVVDRIRIVSNTGQNLRVNPADGITILDSPLNPGAPAVNAAAYSNNFAGSTATTLYVIDAATNKLYIQNPPNNGTITEVGHLGVNIEAANGFDIGGSSNKAYGVFTHENTTRVYRINLNNGRTNSKGRLPAQVTGFTIGLGF